MNDVRKYTCAIYDAIEEGILDPNVVIRSCLTYLSEADVVEMCDKNELTEALFPEEEDDDGEDET